MDLKIASNSPRSSIVGGFKQNGSTIDIVNNEAGKSFINAGLIQSLLNELVQKRRSSISMSSSYNVTNGGTIFGPDPSSFVFNKSVKQYVLDHLNKRLINSCRSNLEYRTSCEDAENVAFKFVFPFMLVLSMIGNSLTLVVYRSKFLKNASTVSLLSLKAFANLAGVCCLSSEMIKHYNFNFNKNSNFEQFYWYIRPYALFFVNYFGTLAVWCTLMITLETYFCIAFPIRFRKWSQKSHICILIASMLTLSALHHLALPITRTTNEYLLCLDTVKRYQMVIRNGTIYHTYESVYYIVQSVTVIVVPNLMMLVFCTLIACKFKKKNVGQCFSRRRRCVLRITITTTISYCILETPNLFVFLAVAWRGSSVESNESLCIVSLITNFLSISNATIPFVVYVSFNGTFRQLLFVQLASLFGLAVEPRERLYTLIEANTHNPTNPITTSLSMQMANNNSTEHSSVL